MAEMLSAKEMQSLLQVDRSTIYRMAEAGRLPAIKVGKQWRFPNDQVEKWLQTQAAAPASALPLGPNGTLAAVGAPASAKMPLASLLPLDCVQLIQDAFAETLGVMLIITDLEGQPLTQASNPCPVYTLLAETQNGHNLCQEKWQELGDTPALEPRFKPGWGGLLCARALVRVGNELKGMVITSGIAPHHWPPANSTVAELAHSLQVAPDKLEAALGSTPSLPPAEQKRVLLTLQRIADILAHIVSERSLLMGRLDTISKLSAL